MSSTPEVPSTLNPSPQPHESGVLPIAPSRRKKQQGSRETGRLESGATESRALESLTLESGTLRSSLREVLVLSLLPPLCAAYLTPADPLLIQGSFPWFVLVPVLVGVQHGALAATLGSGLLVSVGVLHHFVAGREGLGELLTFAAGCLAFGVISGHAHDRTRARLARLGQQATLAARRLARLSRAHAVLELSHQRLEERLAASSWSLASAFEDARRELDGATSISAAAPVLLDVLANHALVQSATLLEVAAVDARGDAELVASASIGSPPALDLTHPLVQRALATGRLVALDAESADASADDTVLCVAPLAASGGLLGLVVIHEMPFMAFQAENLKGLAALTALLADMLEERFLEPRAGEPLLALVPEHNLRSLPAHEEPAAPEADSEAGAGSNAGEFVGTRTGTHRRRGMAQSA